MNVKICGLTSVTDALAVAEAGADWIGLNFHPGSARRVEIDVARAIVASLPAPCAAVGLFVNRPAVEVAALAEWLGLGIVQLHGSEPVADLAFYGGFRVIRAFRIADQASLDAMQDYARLAAETGHPLHAVLVDASVPGQFGGTGQRIADDLLARITDLIPALPPLILAGGLTPENVAARIARVRPWMVDVAGGVESAPGRKDAARVSAFIRAARGVVG
ncbi:MAG: phosphoribosylanthranilate isomerase [Planctomycetota bacterium]|nr:phosphoribosylanthranilate isomerase [Planctomycetota bacterium]